MNHQEYIDQTVTLAAENVKKEVILTRMSKLKLSKSSHWQCIDALLR